MIHVFQTYLILSCAGAVLTILLLLIRPVTIKIFGSVWQYYIWLAILLVMVLPLDIDLLPETDAPFPLLVQETQETASPTENRGQPEHAPLDRTNLWKLFSFLWLAGTVIFFTTGVTSYLLYLKNIRKDAKPVSCPGLETIKREIGIRSKITVWQTSCTASPLILGILKPVLLLPNQELNEEQLRYVMLHELTHYQRRDLWSKWFAMLVNSIHWFNPLVYIAVRQMNNDCEISCDFEVTKDMQETEKRAYMNTILAFMSNQKQNEMEG